MRTMIVPALLVISNLAQAATATDPLQAAWESFGRGAKPKSTYARVLDDKLSDLLWTAAHARKSLDEAAALVASAHHVGPEAAADLVEASVITESMPGRFDDDRDPALAERAASALWRAYRREPAARIVLDQAGWIVFEIEDDPAELHRMVDELRRSADPAPLAAYVAAMGLGREEIDREALAIGLASRPDAPGLLLGAAGLDREDPCAAAAWAREALASAEARNVRDAPFLGAARNTLLAALLEAGLDREALDRFEAMPIAGRSAALGEDVEGNSNTRLDDLDYSFRSVRLRSSLASAAFLAGERERAIRLASGDPPPLKDKERDEERERLAIVRAAFERIAGGGPADAFDTLEKALVSGESFERMPRPLTALWARLASETDYPDIAAELWRRRNAWRNDPAPVPARIAAAVAACRSVSVDPAAASEARERADAASAGIASRLAAEPLKVFAEHPLPAGVAPWDPPDAERRPLEEKLKAWKLPGLWPVRVDAAGNDVVAIGLAQDYDPAGEVSGGGYWVARSHDRGKTWSRALYTGLRPMQPYVIRSFSKLAMIDGDRLRIEVDLRELDTTKITFPPIGRSFTRTESGIYLEAAWADLERDRDGDGLTDLAEERLMTDPDSADTDGDGLRDGEDPLPHVAASSKASALTGALAALLQGGGYQARPILTGDPGGQKTDADDTKNVEAVMEKMLKDAVALTSEATTFIRGDRAAFAGMTADHRIVVLSDSEADRARERFGVHYPATIRIFMDHAGSKALAIWNESWRGETVHLEKVGGVWRRTPVSSWIT
ncbi:MAG TPA: hypothetical protein VFV19_02940 [Candidatus Polarisedimenticolaceae bacterium]|nr:hypothetical protein [Candidatus Polarisedimenticolaceae bacterium]